MKAKLRLRSRQPLLSFAAFSLLALGAATAQVAAAADAAPPAESAASYRAQVQDCKAGRTQQDRATCLLEARNAHAAQQRGALSNGASPAQYEANAMARCEVFKDAESKAACEARVMGYGNVSGSVAGGGVLREVETVVLPPGQDSVTIEPKTSDPVLLVPVPATQVKPAQ
ncbi:hypothetical protein PE066_14390 [Ramlibacter tataouinensis]|uniref:hypothetical protein n=1 Tax=Ramlibacter tataouinensis TaxID=94132 RepID=UPI0022F404C0|nr:hypothetical protein [Ramlibacter tataouinensis]WBY00648.1 hypothetical protein PE066_14390 [Ramlibacter tataouinensis]